jgi:zinc transporter, ZIP family
MSFTETALLGALAGFTIYLGLPFGRLQLLSDRARVALAMFSVGVLAFIFVDVMAHAFGIVEGAVEGFKDDSASLGHALFLAALLGIGFALGSAGLATIERRLRLLSPLPPISGGAVDVLTADQVVQQQAAAARQSSLARARSLRIGMTIAVAIGLHNFAEGLAIGVSASAGDISLATVLIVGFALHNATEGFGIVGPLGEVRPSWGWLGLVGLIGGAPTFLGSMLGYSVTSEPLELAFYALAGGAILYVIGEIRNGMRRYGHRELGLWLIAFGFFVGVATDLVVAYGGG